MYTRNVGSHSNRDDVVGMAVERDPPLRGVVMETSRIEKVSSESFPEKGMKGGRKRKKVSVLRAAEMDKVHFTGAAEKKGEEEVRS